MQDCFESIETEYFAEELQSAKMAVETAGMAYSELLEELALTDEGIPLLNEIRKLYAPAVESLRQELRGIVKDVEDETWEWEIEELTYDLDTPMLQFRESQFCDVILL